MKKIIVLAALMPMLLAGCNTAPKQYEQQLSDKGASFALKVAKLGGCGANLKDVEPEIMEQALRQNDGVTNSDLALSATSGLLQSGLSGLSLNFFRSLSTSSVALSQNNCVIAWMPEKMAASEDEASGKFFEILERAAENNYMLGAYQKVSKNDSVTRSIQFRPIDASLATYGNGVRHATKVNAPEWLGSQKTYFIGKGEAFIGRYVDSYEKAAPFDEVEYLKKVSHDLPDWAYIYVAPKPWMLPYPVVLNQGKTYYFVRDDADLNTDRHVSAL